MQNVIKAVLLLFCLLGVNTLFGQVCIYNTSPSNPISLTNVTNDTIKNLTISNPNGRGIALYYCKNVVIENCAINSTLDEGIYLYDCENITVKSCSFSNNRAGVVALLGSAIKVLNNQFLNPGDYGNQIKGQFVQFDKVTGAGNKINNNVGESILGESYPEDLVSIYQSFGTINSPIEVKGNRFRGGGPSASGGGIMTGDLGGGYILVEDNILVNPGQYGIAIASGVNIKVIHNQVYSKRQPFSNVGIYVWNQSQNSCENHEVWGNLVNYLDSNGNSNSHWDGGNCGSIVGWGANFWNANIDSSILPAKLLCPDHSGVGVFPNPFISTINVSVEMSQAGMLKATLYDLNGSKVADMINEYRDKGSYQIAWTSKDALANGIYIIKLSKGGEVYQMKVLKTGN